MSGRLDHQACESLLLISWRNPVVTGAPVLMLESGTLLCVKGITSPFL